MSTIWVDLDNAPHVPLFRPLILQLQQRGHRVYVTARDYGYTRDLIEETGIPYDLIGRHAGKNIYKKVGGILTRVAMLVTWARGKNIDVGVSHGSRALVLACRILQKPCVTMYDYEFVSTSVFNKLSTKLLLPDILSGDMLKSMGVDGNRLARYPGFKEEVYIGDFTPDPSILASLDVRPSDVVAVIRPPATAAHYHDPLSEEIIHAVFDRISKTPNVVGIITPRTTRQGDSIRGSLADPSRFRILQKPLNGLNLIANADLVIGGGGTMNREAALLGVPVFSVFTAKMGTIDRKLSEEKKLTMVRNVGEVDLVKFVKRDRSDYAGRVERWRARSKELVEVICDEILKTAKS